MSSTHTHSLPPTPSISWTILTSHAQKLSTLTNERDPHQLSTRKHHQLKRSYRTHASLDISEPTLLRPFERISGRRTTPHIQSEYGQVSRTSEARTSFSLLEVISLESLTREFDLGLLSAFPAPPNPGKTLFCVVFVTV
jgi:hypothetical protein